MSVGETFSASSTFLKICLVLAPLQTLLYIIGFSTTGWVTKKASVNFDNNNIGINFGISLATIQEGLWKVCIADSCAEISWEQVSGWLHATRLFATIALIGFMMSTAGVFVCLFITELSQRRILHILTTVLAAGTGVAVLVAVLIYGSHYNNPIHHRISFTMDLGWSFGLCVGALVLDIITTILLIINVVKKPNL
ncbi:uncharacterized protein LOC125647613 [Ostrea edulis]|uniref:uncharacterized protein LOC125647613 n=1 Tax=Ostrea edulis TaxID=37623 RepID=UPI0024AF8525|nr:uncharacterized protein LOC125647613 [Ostrea edulis]